MIVNADARRIPLANQSVHCVITSPPYWGLRDYGVDGQLGLERTPEHYTEGVVAVFREVWRVLRDDGTLWLNLGDSYYTGDKGGTAKGRVSAHESLQRSNLGANFIGAPNRLPHPFFKPKDLVGVPWMVAVALRADGWYLRSDVIWSKPNPMPESVTDRPTKAHEYLFLLAKGERYYYDAEAIREPHTSIEKYGVRGSADWQNLTPRTADAKMSVPSTTMARGTLVSRHPDYVGHVNGRNRRSVWEISHATVSGGSLCDLPRSTRRTLCPCGNIRAWGLHAVWGALGAAGRAEGVGPSLCLPCLDHAPTGL